MRWRRTPLDIIKMLPWGLELGGMLSELCPNLGEGDHSNEIGFIESEVGIETWLLEKAALLDQSFVCWHDLKVEVLTEDDAGIAGGIPIDDGWRSYCWQNLSIDWPEVIVGFLDQADYNVRSMKTGKPAGMVVHMEVNLVWYVHWVRL